MDSDKIISWGNGLGNNFLILHLLLIKKMPLLQKALALKEHYKAQDLLCWDYSILEP